MTDSKLNVPDTLVADGAIINRMIKKKAIDIDKIDVVFDEHSFLDISRIRIRDDHWIKSYTDEIGDGHTTINGRLTLSNQYNKDVFFDIFSNSDQYYSGIRLGKNKSNYWEMFNSTTGYMGFYKGGIGSDKSDGVQFVINPNGNVAIGAAGWSGIAKEKLHVHGNVQIDGRLLVRELNLVGASWKNQTHIQYITFHGSETQFMDGFMVGDVYTGNKTKDNDLLVRTNGVFRPRRVIGDINLNASLKTDTINLTINPNRIFNNMISSDAEIEIKKTTLKPGRFMKFEEDQETISNTLIAGEGHGINLSFDEEKNIINADLKPRTNIG